MSTLHVMFRVADAAYVVPAADVAVMESFEGATRVPGTPAHVAGLVQIRGAVVPVVDLRVRFGLPPAAPTLDSRVVVVQAGTRRVGLLVDSARDVVRIAEDAFQPPPAAIQRQASGFVQAVAQVAGRLVMLIDHAKVIGEEQGDGD
jgi:purine-binding chemotaxis protein CheW